MQKLLETDAIFDYNVFNKSANKKSKTFLLYLFCEVAIIINV